MSDKTVIKPNCLVCGTAGTCPVCIDKLIRQRARPNWPALLFILLCLLVLLGGLIGCSKATLDDGPPGAAHVIFSDGVVGQVYRVQDLNRPGIVCYVTSFGISCLNLNPPAQPACKKERAK
jgi:hypothetical protein